MKRKRISIALALLVVLASLFCWQLFSHNGLIAQQVVKNQRAGFEEEMARLDSTYSLAEGVREISGANFNFYIPEQLTGNERVVVNVHGGGLIMGSKEFNRYFNSRMAQKGFIVVAVEYPLAPESSIENMLQVLSKNIDAGCDSLIAFLRTNEKFAPYAEQIAAFIAEGVFVTGDSAGGFLAFYTAAMQNDSSLRQLMNASLLKYRIRAMGLFSAMFYTTWNDRIGFILSHQIWGDGYKQRFGDYVDPEYVLGRGEFPPMYLFASAGDFIASYTMTFAEAAKRKGSDFRLKYFDDEKLVHAFQVFMPEEQATYQTIDALDEFFK